MSIPKIDAYRFGKITFDGVAYSTDVIILPDRVVANWWRAEGHVLNTQDLDHVFAACPQTLVVGTGADGRMSIADETRKTLQEAGIDLIEEQTNQACLTYNRIRDQQRVAAALHLTC